MYTWVNRLMQSWKMAVINRWNVEGELQSSICITWLMNVPSTVANAVFGIKGRSMHICSCASDILSFDQYAAWAISFQMISWSGNGVTSLTVLLFCFHISNAVLSLLLFFSTHNIGTAWYATVVTHHPVVAYCWIFSDNSSQKCSAHFGKWYFICFLGSIKLITWLTSLKGGSSSGIPPSRSVIFSFHAILRNGMSLSVKMICVSDIRCVKN